jgi:hypothetical protein
MRWKCSQKRHEQIVAKGEPKGWAADGSIRIGNKFSGTAFGAARYRQANEARAEEEQ